MSKENKNGWRRVMFDNDSDYVRFVEDVFEHYEREGMRVGRSQIRTEVVVDNRLLRKLKQREYRWRAVRESDVVAAREAAAGRGGLLFDPVPLEELEVPKK